MTNRMVVGGRAWLDHRVSSKGRRQRVTHPLQWARTAIGRGDTRARLAERVATYLRQQLPEDHVVIALHAARDGGARVPVVVIGRDRVVVIEPRDDEGELLCYQDHWYRSEAGRLTETLSDPPSVRAHDNAARVRNDLGTGGFLNVQIEPIVVLTRGKPDDVRSSSVPVIAGLDPLVRHILTRRVSSTDRVRTLALAAALARNITLTGV